LSAELTKMHSFRLFFADFAHWVTIEELEKKANSRQRLFFNYVR